MVELVATSPGTEEVSTPGGGDGRRRGRAVLHFFGRAHGLFLLIGTVFVGIFLVLVPPGWGLDEQTHFYRAYQISEGTLFPSTDPTTGTYLYSVPRSIYDLLQQGWADGNSIDRAAPSYRRHDMPEPSRYPELEGAALNSGDRVSADITQTIPNVPVVYAASSIGLALARALNTDVGTMVMFAKIANALTYLALAFTAVWFARRLRFRWLVMVTALLPAAIFQSAVITADTFTNGVCLLFMAVLVTLILERRPATAPVLALLAAAAVGVALSKPTYALLILAISVLPAATFRSRNWGRWYKAIVLFVSLLLLALTVYLGSRGSIAVVAQRGDVASAVNARDQAILVLTHPFEGLAVVARTIEVYGQSWVQGVVGLFGYNTVAVPAPFTVLLVLAVVAAGFYSERLRRTAGWVILGVGCLVGLALIGVFYLTFTPVGDPVAAGVQGRYFIACVLAVTIGLAGILPVRVAMRAGTAEVLFAATSAASLIAAVTMYYLNLY